MKTKSSDRAILAKATRILEGGWRQMAGTIQAGAANIVHDTENATKDLLGTPALLSGGRRVKNPRRHGPVREQMITRGCATEAAVLRAAKVRRAEMVRVAAASLRRMAAELEASAVL